MNYQESIDWLFSQLPMFSRVGAAAYKPGLERSEALAEFFGNPHHKFKSIHIAGTNGKGSVSNLMAAVLQSQGYKVGLYTSPHLIDFRERIRINGEMISKEEVAEFVSKWIATEYSGDKPSFFELTMIMAFEWFARQQVDYAVIEVGMGGRLDSTNIITPVLSVITNISKDHTQFLGNTLTEIASEKAGIIKPGIPVVIGEAVNETEKVFREKASSVAAPLREAYREIDEIDNSALNCPLKGDYQKKNVNTARIAIDELIRSGVVISDSAIAKGFAEVETITGFKGRWTIVSDSPLTICDTGHNEAGLRFNLTQLQKILNDRPGAMLRFVIGFVADKDIDNILKLFPADAEYYLSNAQMPRALPAGILYEKFLEAGNVPAENLRHFPSVKGAFNQALSDSSPEDIVFIGGSTFIVADYLSSFSFKKETESKRI